MLHVEAKMDTDKAPTTPKIGPMAPSWAVMIFPTQAPTNRRFP
jgi:hypothetical protein